MEIGRALLRWQVGFRGVAIHPNRRRRGRGGARNAGQTLHRLRPPATTAGRRPFWALTAIELQIHSRVRAGQFALCLPHGGILIRTPNEDGGHAGGAWFFTVHHERSALRNSSAQRVGGRQRQARRPAIGHLRHAPASFPARHTFGQRRFPPGGLGSASRPAHFLYRKRVSFGGPHQDAEPSHSRAANADIVAIGGNGISAAATAQLPDPRAAPAPPHHTIASGVPQQAEQDGFPTLAAIGADPERLPAAMAPGKPPIPIASPRSSSRGPDDHGFARTRRQGRTALASRRAKKGTAGITPPQTRPASPARFARTH